MNVVFRDTATEADTAYIDTHLEKFNVETTGVARVRLDIVLEIDGACRGGIRSSIADGHLLISRLYLDPDLRGNGYGKQLMDAVENKAREAGCTAAFVDTMAFQAPDFYTRCGYSETAVIRNFYPGYDRIFFRKTLAA